MNHVLRFPCAPAVLAMRTAIRPMQMRRMAGMLGVGGVPARYRLAARFDFFFPVFFRRGAGLAFRMLPLQLGAPQRHL